MWAERWRTPPAVADKTTAPPEIAVVGRAAKDDSFRSGGHRIRYSVEIGQSRGPFRMEAELGYQPIGYRWAHNVDGYDTFETRRFSGYFSAMSSESAIVLARAKCCSRLMLGDAHSEVLLLGVFSQHPYIRGKKDDVYTEAPPGGLRLQRFQAAAGSVSCSRRKLARAMSDWCMRRGSRGGSVDSASLSRQ